MFKTIVAIIAVFALYGAAMFYTLDSLGRFGEVIKTKRMVIKP